jgi:HAD superfamily hydrolase (TIGR01509 family)
MTGRDGSEIGAVVFDLDGVLIESEQIWDEVRRKAVADLGGRWREGATRAMQGMSSPEWSRYVHDELGVALPPDRIADIIVGGVLERYQRSLPLLPGAVEAVRRLAARWPLAVASSANRVLIDHVVEYAGLQDAFRVTVSSEEVPRGKPAPDVYLEAARRLGVPAAACVAVEDSANGIRSAKAAGMTVIAIPNREFPPPPEVLGTADAVIPSLDELRPELLTRA